MSVNFNVRWLNAVLLAAVVTCALFVLMHRLTIGGNDGVYTHTWRLLALDFIRIHREQTLNEKERFFPPKPQVVKQQQHQAVMPFEPALQALTVPKVEIQPYIPAFDGVFDVVNFAQTHEIAPLARVKPMYPPSAERRGIEGWVKVTLTIVEDGSVVDVRVVDAEPKAVFDQSVLSAISKWRYQPQLIDGQAVQRTGVGVTVEFRLEQ